MIVGGGRIELFEHSYKGRQTSRLMFWDCFQLHPPISCSASQAIFHPVEDLYPVPKQGFFGALHACPSKINTAIWSGKALLKKSMAFCLIDHPFRIPPAIVIYSATVFNK